MPFTHAFFRCDASTTIGSGHLVRCLAMAEQFRELGLECGFICRELPGSPLHLLTGYQSYLLPPDTNEQEELSKVSSLLQAHPEAFLVVDRYGCPTWERHWAGLAPLVVIDDIANENHLCHALINSNYGINFDHYIDHLPPGTPLFLGPGFSILRKAFWHVSSDRQPRRDVLLFFGAGDAEGWSLRFAQALIHQDSPLTFRLWVSSQNAFIEELKRLSLPPHLELVIEPTDIVSLLQSCRIFYGSAGTVTWERLRCGLPGITASVADNQIPGAKALADDGYQIFLGRQSTISPQEAIAVIERTIQEESRLRAMAERGRTLVQPLMASDILQEAARTLRLRPAVLDDAQFLYELRTETSTASASIQKNDFSFESHQKWLRNKLSDPKANLYIVIWSGERVGQVRVDADTTVSISIRPDKRGQKIGEKALFWAVHLRNDSCNFAFIQPHNFPSQKIFERIGFRKIGEENQNGVPLWKYERKTCKPNHHDALPQ